MAPEKLQSTGEWEAIRRAFFTTGRAADVLSSLTCVIDATAIAAYAATIGAGAPQFAAALAAGAYGRRETFPFSGTDLLILLDTDPESPALKDVLAAFTRLLREAGLRLNYSVRTVAECLDVREQNPELLMGLLDRRFLAGDEAVQARLETRLPAVLARHGAAIRQRLCRAARARHTQFENTPHRLDPDVKEGPGGLLDLRLIDWLARLNPDSAGPPLGEHAAAISAVRCFLHYRAGADCNILDREPLDDLARQPFAGGKSSGECLRELLGHARAVFHEARRAIEASEKTQSGLIESFREYRARLSNGEFTVSRDRLLLRNPAHIEGDPELLLRVFDFMARHGIQAASETTRRLSAAAPAFAAYFSRPHPVWPALKTVLPLPHAGMALRALEDACLLAALFPEWGAIENLSLDEPGAGYTADEHSLRSIECVAKLRSASDASLQRFAELLAEIDQPALLVFALLCQAMGIEGASAAMERIAMPQEDRAHVEFLLAHRNDLAGALVARDTEDPAAARSLAELAGTVERLKLLAIFTYANAAAGADSMAPWRAEQLWRACSIAREELTRELETERIEQAPADLAGQADFLKGFPVRYLRAHSLAELAGHVRLYERSRPTGVAVQIERLEGAWRLSIIARDRPALFASLAATISSFDVNILKAEAFCNAKGIVLDTFVFADPQRLLLNPSETDRFTDLVERMALGRTDLRRLLRHRAPPQPKKHAGTAQVRFDSQTSDAATLVEISTEDRPGLLYSLASVFSAAACNIDVVLIDTKGHRAMDVFYVSHDGRKLAPELEASLKENLLAAC